MSMNKDSKSTRIEATPELLTEMEMLEIYGGVGDVGEVYGINCDKNKYCGTANCAPQCACTHTKDCNLTGGGDVAPPKIP